MKRRGAYAAMPAMSRCLCGGIAPSRKEGALTPRCPRCPDACVGVSRGRKKKRRLRRDTRVGYRGVTNGTPRYAFRLSQMRIAPSRKEGAFTPRCPRCHDACVGVSHGRKKKRRLRRDARAVRVGVSRRREKKRRLRRDAPFTFLQRDNYLDKKSCVRFWPCLSITLHNSTPREFMRVPSG